MSLSPHPIIILSDSDVEDTFSSTHSLDYIPASPDYSPASPGNTPESLNNSYGLVPIASPTLSLFHDDPYMKVMHAYDAIISSQVPISPPIIVPPSLMLSPIFNLQELFVPEELLPPKKQTHLPSLSSTDLANPSRKQAYSYYVLSYVDRMAPKRTSTSAASSMTQAAIRQLIADGNDLKTYIRRFHELALLCPNMVPNSKKLVEVFIGGLPRSIEGNVISSKPQTLEEAITITQRLMEQVIKHNSAQETNYHKRKFKDERNTNNNNNYPNDRNNNNYSINRNNNNYQDNRNNNHRNNNHQQQQNGRHETFRTYRNHGYNGPHPLCKDGSAAEVTEEITLS
nr:reverse transcriptase domain-containing protein [Tanacetum cinerariifolium]